MFNKHKLFYPRELLSITLGNITLCMREYNIFRLPGPGAYPEFYFWRGGGAYKNIRVYITTKHKKKFKKYLLYIIIMYFIFYMYCETNNK